MPLLKERSPTEEFIKVVWRENPVFVPVLGMCPVVEEVFNHAPP